MDISTINSDLIRGNVTTIILKALYDGTSYGYDILKLIEEKTNGKYVIKQPTLYSCLKRLEKQGLIESYMGTDDDTSGARRRYYTLTQVGTDYLKQQQAEYEYSRTILDRLLSDQVYDLTSETTPFDINDLRPYTKVNLDNASDDVETKVVEKVVEKPVYIEKPVEVEKIVYVDRPVEKVVYVDRYPDGSTVAKKEPAPAAPTHTSGIIINNQNRQQFNQQPQQQAPQQQAPQQPVYGQPYQQQGYVQQQEPVRQTAPQTMVPPQEPQYNQPSGIIINGNRVNREQQHQQYNQMYNQPYQAAPQQQGNVDDASRLPQAPLINRMQEQVRTNANGLPSDQNAQARAFRPANYVAPEETHRTTEEAQDRASKILGIGKYRKNTTIDPTGEDDSPYGLNR